MRMPLRFLFCCAGLLMGISVLVMALTCNVAAQTLRAAQHANYGRMVFDWSAPVEYSADIVDGRLVIRFDREISGSLRPILTQMPTYLRGGSVSDDRRSVTFPLRDQFRLEASRNGNAIVIDLKKDESSPVPAAAMPSSPSPAATAAQPQSTPAVLAKKDAPEVLMRVGNHTGHSRLVFDWTSSTPYTVDQNGSQVTLSFGKEASLNTKAARSLPADIKLDDVSVTDGKTIVRLTIPPDARPRHFRVGTKIALDIVRSAQGEAPRQEGVDAAVPLAPGPEIAHNDAPPSVAPSPVTPVAAASLAPQSLSTANRDGASATGLGGSGPFAGTRSPDQAPIQSTGRSLQKMPPPLSLPPLAQEQQPQSPAEPATGSVASVQGDASTSPEEAVGRLVFKSRRPAALAMFRRAGWLWFVFDQPLPVDLTQVKKDGGAFVQKIESVPLAGGTALRLLVDPTYNPEARSDEDGKTWTISLSERPLLPKVSIEMAAVTDSAQSKLVLGTGVNAKPWLINDPEVGDQIRVVTVTTAGLGIPKRYDLTDLTLLPTAQGAVIIPLSDNLEILSTQQTTEISVVGGGLQISDAEVRGDRPPPVAASDGSLLDIPLWYGTMPFLKEHRLLRSAVDTMGNQTPIPTQEERNQTRMALIRHLVAHGYDIEALGELDLMAREDPSQVDTPAFRAARGAANYLAGRYSEAVDDLSNPGLKNDASAQLWLALARARVDAPGSQAEAVKNNAEILRLYPKDMKLRLGLDALSVAVAGKDTQTALTLQKILTDEALDGDQKAWVSYARARVQELLNGPVDNISKLYADAENSDSRLLRALAGKARIDFLLRNKKISIQDAIEGYERLRFSWRGGDFEFDLLKRLGELYMQAGDYPNGLRTLRDLAAGFSSRHGPSDGVQMRREAVVKLYLDGEADKMQPLTAIALYNEFQELLPSGAKGDQLIQRLADRLVSVDLLNEAADLLQQQIQNRLSGVDKGRVGARLALIYVLNRQPEKALDALKASEVQGMSLELLGQRRRLKARALADMGAHQDALALLDGDDTREADILRSEIYWKNGDWTQVAESLKGLVSMAVPSVETPIDDETAGIVVDWATALILAGDEQGVDRLRRLYGERMEKTAYRDEFLLLTAENEQGVPDYRTVPGKIKQVEDYRTAYLKKLRKEGLSSAIN